MSELTTSAGNATPAAGDTIGRRYRVIRRIGEGGMGVVVEAENVVTGKRVAIKWMHPEVAAQPEAAERFLREARASARVRHPNVVDMYDAVHEGDTCFLVMELLEGEPLSVVLERGGMPAHALIGLLLDAMRGVVAAHKRGVIHRDIKPDNIFLAIESDHGPLVPKVLDFGISKVMSAELASLTRTGAAMGTPMYMSYEQLCGVKDIDLRTDVYAFGVVLYEALTGRAPYQAGNLPQLVAKMAHTVPVPARQLRPEIPEALDRVIQRAMSKQRETRTESLEVLIAELTPFAKAQALVPQLSAATGVLPIGQLAASNAAEPSLVVVGRESVPVGTPMEANVPIPAAPRRRDALAWLVAAGVIATLVSVLTAYGRLKPAAAPGDGFAGSAAPAAASGGEVEPARVQSAAATKSDPRLLVRPTAGADEHRVKPTAARAAMPGFRPSTAAKPSVAAAPSNTNGSAPRAALVEGPAPTERLITLPRASSAAPASKRPQVPPLEAKPSLSEPSAASARFPTQDSGAAEAPRPSPLPADGHRFRAGRPRTEDF
jgi:tRNA A-37 threonylcarbamoyl transferase component Bud32